MITGRVGAISGLLAIGLCIATVSQAHAQAQGSIVQRVTALESAVSSLQAQLATLQSQMAGIQANGALALAPYVSVQTGDINGLTGPHVIFEGANVHIRSGSGFTDDNTPSPFGVGFFGDASGTLTGRGNLIIGYDETSALSGTLSSGPRTGSHNLVVGPVHTFSSWGGMVAGFKNAITGISSSVSGGGANTASGDLFSSVSGGQQNTASGTSSSVSGGVLNTASGNESSVSGGSFSRASGRLSSVSGGQTNHASGDFSSVSGGQTNIASGFVSSVSGGSHRSATDEFNWAAGSLSEPN